MSIVESKNQQYEEIVSEFDAYLINTYDIHASREDLNDRILAFIERYGVKTTTNKSALKKVKDDYLVADFLVFCEENGKSGIIDYLRAPLKTPARRHSGSFAAYLRCENLEIHKVFLRFSSSICGKISRCASRPGFLEVPLNEYTIGLALSEVFTYCETPEKYTSAGAHVYLDTGLLFRLFNIDSASRADSYKAFLENIRHTGMHIAVYEHSINEMVGIIEGSKYWIGNPDYDDTQASEATRFFVSNGWTVEEVDELSCNIRTRVENEFNIKIDKTPYPKQENIVAPYYEARIKEMIIAEYKSSNPNADIEALDHSIDYDSKSLFLTQQKNENKVPYHIDDVKNIFITMNRSLARVGYEISFDLADSKEYFIPLVMTDIKWGTLIWFNNPAIISTINRPRLVSAAYAAFRPSTELIKKLNAKLSDLEKKGDITPEQCYLLKVSPIAQRLLARKTVNDPEKFIDRTPLDIIKEIEDNAYERGSNSRQNEIDELTRDKKGVEFNLAVEKQRSIVRELQLNNDGLNRDIEVLRKQIQDTALQLDEYKATKRTADQVIERRVSTIKKLITVVAGFLLIGSFYLGSHWSWIVGACSATLPILLFIIAIWKNKEVKVLSFLPKMEEKIRDREYSLRRYSEEKYYELTEKEQQTREDMRLKTELKRETEDGLNDELKKLSTMGK